MRKLFFLLLLFQTFLYSQSNSYVEYQVDLSNHLDDFFHVTVIPGELSASNNYYHFPANVPGTYGRENFGRFVMNFKAFNKQGVEIPVERESQNSWSISDPEKVAKITYDVEDTYDSDAEGGYVMPMSGSGIDSNYVVMNTHTVAGYFEGRQFYPVKLKVDYPEDWQIGTSLEYSDGYFIADNYNELVDNPILIGTLSKSSFMVGDVEVNIFVYSTHPEVTAERLANMSEGVLKASEGFIGYSPVKKYSFLMCFWDIGYARELHISGFGALEHNTSSLYTMPIMGKPDERQLAMFKETMAHEFCHILTPLNLRSEKISNYNFIEPEVGQHLWLYEGVTEWASNIMLLRGGEISLEEYLQLQSRKIEESLEYDQSISLVDLSRNIYNPKYSVNFMDFYRRAALVAAMLDIKILELSGGKKGLRDVFIELIKTHGEDKPFNDEQFFNLLIEKTYPEIREFIDDYILHANPLPINEYFNKLGIAYSDSKISSDTRPTFGVFISMRPGAPPFISKVYDEVKQYGFQKGDTVLELEGQEVGPRTLRKIFEDVYSQKKVGDVVHVKIKRGDEVIEIESKLVQRLDFYNFEVDKNCSDEQQRLQKAWMTNL